MLHTNLRMMVFFYQELKLCVENYHYHNIIIKNIILCWAKELNVKFCDFSYLIN